MPRSYKTVAAQGLHYFVRPHTGRPRGPIQSPAAWLGSDLAQQAAWRDPLGTRDVDELQRALDHARRSGKPDEQLTAGDFPLPDLSRRVGAWREAVLRGVGVQIVRGLPVERWSPADCETVFWCLGQHLGTPGCQNRDGELLGHVRDLGASYADPATRGYKTAAHLAYHCDAADAVGLLCLRPAKTGGVSRIASSVTVFNQLWSQNRALAARLFDPFLLDTRGDGGLDFFPITPCRHSRGQLRTFYHSNYFRSAEQHPGARPLDKLGLAALDAYDAIASTAGVFLEMRMVPGDIQLLSNHTVLHSRTAYEDDPEATKKRHLLRLWLSFNQPRSWRGRPSEVRETARLASALGAGKLRKRLGPGTSG